MKTLTTLILLTLSLSANAVYKCKTPDGKLIYSQIRCEGKVTDINVKEPDYIREKREAEVAVKQAKRQAEMEAEAAARAEAKVEVEKKLEKEQEMNKFRTVIKEELKKNGSSTVPCRVDSYTGWCW